MEENKTETKTSSKSLKNLNKTPLLIAGLVVLTGILLAVSLKSKTPSLPSLNQQETKQDYAHTTLFFSDVRENGAGSSEMDVNISSEDNVITGVQLELSYDPKSLTRVDIAPGDFMEDPVVILKKIDPAQGRISYVLGNPLGKSGIQGNGPVAVITFTKTAAADTNLEFLSETLVTAEGHTQSVLKETISAVITSPESSSPSAQ